MSKKKIDACQVMDTLRTLAAEQPDRVDRRADSGVLVPKYVEYGLPSCIAAQVMYDLGISMGMIKQLDRELSGTGGIILRLSDSLMRRRFTPAAWGLLDYVQRRNDWGMTWGRIMDDLHRDVASTSRSYVNYRAQYSWVLEIEALGGEW
jgi:hypothetical protein